MAITVGNSTPSSFVVGDTVKWSLLFAGYTPGVDTVMAGFSGPTRFILTAIAYPDNAARFLFTIAPDTDVKAGDYILVYRVTDSAGNVSTIDQARICALPNIGAPNPELDTLEAKLTSAKNAYYALAQSTRSQVSVDGINYTNRNASELWSFVAWLERRIAAEKNKVASALGRGTSGLYVTRFRN